MWGAKSQNDDQNLRTMPELRGRSAARSDIQGADMPCVWRAYTTLLAMLRLHVRLPA